MAYTVQDGQVLNDGEKIGYTISRDEVVHLPDAPKPFDSEWVDKRTSNGPKPEPEIHGKIAGFHPAPDRVLVKRLPKQEMAGSIVKPQVGIEESERGYVVAVGLGVSYSLPIGCIATFGKFGAEEKNFDDQGDAVYALVWIDDIRGWHDAID